MATTTTNFGWDIPQSTDLVKDGATAIAALGQDIDTALVDLKGGTTGQILSKASNTDLDYTWITNDVGDITAVTAGTGISGGGTSGAVTVTNSMATAITTAGDVIYGTGSGTFSRLGIGTAGQVLAVNGGATAPSWVSPSTSGMTLVKTQTIGSGVSSVNVTSAFSSTYDNYKIVIVGGVSSTNQFINLKLGATTTAYYWAYSEYNFAASAGGAAGSNVANFERVGYGTTATNFFSCDVFAPNLAKNTNISFNWIANVTGGGAGQGGGLLNNTTQYTDFTIGVAGTLTGGTIRVYGYQNS
jgi:hypothetical protein